MKSEQMKDYRRAITLCAKKIATALLSIHPHLPWNNIEAYLPDNETVVYHVTVSAKVKLIRKLRDPIVATWSFMSYSSNCNDFTTIIVIVRSSTSTINNPVKEETSSFHSVEKFSYPVPTLPVILVSVAAMDMIR